MKNHNIEHDLKRGTIMYDAHAAMVTSALFRPKRFKAKKGKGSFKRTNNWKKEPYQNPQLSEHFAKALFCTLTYSS
ncbi:alternative ribosome rescue factor ArfA [Vibrio breoganii]